MIGSPLATTFTNVAGAVLLEEPLPMLQLTISAVTVLIIVPPIMAVMRVVRSDPAGTRTLSAATRVEFGPSILVQPGGLLEVGGFALIGVHSLIWLRVSAAR